jgi:hypothetical protein
MKYLIAVGNISDGHKFWGPFDDFDAAELAAFQYFDGCEWWISSIDLP